MSKIFRYEFSIVAEDLGRPPLSATTTVQVRVTDVNDNSPFFLFPTPSNNSVTVPHTLTPNTKVSAVQAYDIDLGRNKELKYGRDSKNGTRFFDVIADTGEVN